MIFFEISKGRAMHYGDFVYQLFNVFPRKKCKKVRKINENKFVWDAKIYTFAPQL